MTRPPRRSASSASCDGVTSSGSDTASGSRSACDVTQFWQFATPKNTHPYEQTWRKPAVTVIAQEASSIKGASNQVLPLARAIVSCRIVPDQDPAEVLEQLTAFLKAFGLRAVTSADAPGSNSANLFVVGDGDGEGPTHIFFRVLGGPLQRALAPQPADLAPQTQRDLAQPVLRDRIVAAHVRREGSRFGRGARWDRARSHGTTTLGLALACRSLTRRMTR